MKIRKPVVKEPKSNCQAYVMDQGWANLLKKQPFAENHEHRRAAKLVYTKQH